MATARTSGSGGLQQPHDDLLLVLRRTRERRSAGVVDEGEVGASEHETLHRFRVPIRPRYVQCRVADTRVLCVDTRTCVRNGEDHTHGTIVACDYAKYFPVITVSDARVDIVVFNATTRIVEQPMGRPTY